MRSPTTLRELRSLRLRIEELAKRDEEALASERRICATRLELAEAALKLKKPLSACLVDLGDDYVGPTAEFIFSTAAKNGRDARERLDNIDRSGWSVIATMLIEIEQKIERELEQ
jgi:hypothetical protein